MILNLILNENEKDIVESINVMGIGRTNKSSEKEVLYKGVKALEQLDKLNNEFIQKLTSNKYSDKAIINLAKEFTQELALLSVYKVG